MKHTPGPWEVDLENGEITAKGPVVIGTIYGADDFPCNEDDIAEECKANACLVATAPELLAACEAALRLAEEMSEGDLYNQIKKAIAKAKGEQ